MHGGVVCLCTHTHPIKWFDNMSCIPVPRIQVNKLLFKTKNTHNTAFCIVFWVLVCLCCFYTVTNQLCVGGA